MEYEGDSPQKRKTNLRLTSVPPAVHIYQNVSIRVATGSVMVDRNPINSSVFTHFKLHNSGTMYKRILATDIPAWQ